MSELLLVDGTAPLHVFLLCFGDLIYVFFAIGDLIYVFTPWFTAAVYHMETRDT